MKLSVIIAALNEADLGNTIQSLRDTAGSRPEVIVVDDCSSMPVQVFDDVGKENTRVIHNTIRCGVGPSRHIGALAASGEFLLITDAHMRFPENWYEEALRRLEGRPKTLHCGQCVGLNSKQMDLSQATGGYFGGTITVYGQDKNKPGAMQVMETVWGPPESDDAEIPSIMGACYFINREWFLRLGALRFLRSWGEDETMLAVKCWLAGGDVRFFAKVRIGHKFLLPGERQRFGVPIGHTVYNKLFMFHTLLTPRQADCATGWLKKIAPIKEFLAGQTMIRENWYLVQQERQYNLTIFHRDFRWLCEKFGLNAPFV